MSQPAAPIIEPAPLLMVQSHGLSDRGRVRSQNEDQFLVAELAKAMRVRQSTVPQPNTQFSDERGYLFVVADGMGGAAGGERASALAVGAIEDFALNTLKWFFHLEGAEASSVLAEFKSALGQADERVLAEAGRHPELEGMGTTVTLGYAVGGVLFVVHVGDSRCYLLRRGTLHLLTHDHTLVNEMVRGGALSPDEAKHHHYRHVITNVVGGTELGVRVEVQKIVLASDDLLLLCSDGLTEVLDDPHIESVLRSERDPKAMCRRLVHDTNARGGPDNVTVVAARFRLGERLQLEQPSARRFDRHTGPVATA